MKCKPAQELFTLDRNSSKPEGKATESKSFRIFFLAMRRTTSAKREGYFMQSTVAQVHRGLMRTEDAKKIRLIKTDGAHAKDSWAAISAWLQMGGWSIEIVQDATRHHTTRPEIRIVQLIKQKRHLRLPMMKTPRRSCYALQLCKNVSSTGDQMLVCSKLDLRKKAVSPYFIEVCDTH